MDTQPQEETPASPRPHHKHRVVLGVCVLVLVTLVFGVAYWMFNDRLQQNCADGSCEPEVETVTEPNDQAGSPLTVPPPSALPSVPQGFPIDQPGAAGDDTQSAL